MIGRKFLQRGLKNFCLTRINNSITLYKISAPPQFALVPPFIQRMMLQNHIKYLFSKQKQSSTDANTSKSKKIGIIPQGVQDFKQIVTFLGYIDKTLVIKTIIDLGKNTDYQTIFRRVGKTLTLSTFQSYVSIEVDKNGKRKYPSTIGLQDNIIQLQNLMKKKKRQKSSEDKKNINNLKKIISEKKEGRQKKLKLKNYFKNKKIMNIPESNMLINDYMGEYPVIFFTSPSFSPGLTTDNAIEVIKVSIQSVYSKHSYLRPLIKEKYGKNSSQYQKFSKFLNGQSISNFDIFSSIVNLRNLLFEFYNRQVYILIDQFEGGFISALRNLDDGNKVVGILSNFYKSFIKDDRMNTNKILIMGVVYIWIPSIFSGLNNLNHLPFTRMWRTSEENSFGYTLQEVKKLMDLAFSFIKSEKQKQYTQKQQKLYDALIDQLKLWANGYYFGNQKFYNPDSVNNYVASLIYVFSNKYYNLQNFQMDGFYKKLSIQPSGEIPLILDYLQDKNNFPQIEAFIRQNFSCSPNLIEETGAIYHVVYDKQKQTQQLLLKKSIYTLLFHTGNLSLDVNQQLCIPPNQSTRKNFFQEIYVYYFSRAKGNLSSELMKDIIDTAKNVYKNLDGEKQQLIKALQLYYQIHLNVKFQTNTNQTGLIQQHQLKMLQTEYEGYLATSRIFAQSINNYTIHQQFETCFQEKKGKMDIFFLPKTKPTSTEKLQDKKNKAIVFQLKIANRSQDVPNKTIQAIIQMINKYLPFVDQFVKGTPQIEKIRFGSIVIFKSDEGRIKFQIDIFSFPKENMSKVIDTIKTCEKNQIIDKLKSLELSLFNSEKEKS